MHVSFSFAITIATPYACFPHVYYIAESIVDSFRLRVVFVDLA